MNQCQLNNLRLEMNICDNTESFSSNSEIIDRKFRGLQISARHCVYFLHVTTLVYQVEKILGN